MKTRISIPCGTITWTLTSALVLLLAAHLISVWRFTSRDFELDRWVWMFNFGYEDNLPSLFAYTLLLLCAVLLMLVSRVEFAIGKKYWRHWLILGLIFGFLAIDEALSFHEVVGQALQKTLQTSGVFYFAWVIPYGIAVLVLGLFFLRFVLALPSRTRSWVVLAGGIYVSGAIGIEMIESVFYEECAKACLIDQILVTIEELMEFTGLIIFSHALLRYISIETAGEGLHPE